MALLVVLTIKPDASQEYFQDCSFLTSLMLLDEDGYGKDFL